MHSTRLWLSLATVLALGGCAGQPAPQSQADAAVPSTPGPPGSNVLNVADAAINSGDPQMALKVSQSVLTADPHNLPALYHEAAAYYAVGRCEDAIAAYKVALGLDPQSSDAQTGIGRCLLKRDAAAAERAFAAAVADDPQNAAALNDLGIARDLRGDFAGAAQPYQQALLIAPGNLSTEVNLGLSLALSGDPDDGLQYLGPLAAGSDATPKIREDYATALIAAGRPDEARQTLAIDVPPQQLDEAMATLTALIAPPVSVPPPVAAAAPATTPATTPGPAAGAAVPVAVQAAPILASNVPPPVAPAPVTPPPLPAAADASLPLADIAPSHIAAPRAPGATIALAPAIAGPDVSTPPLSLFTPHYVHHYRHHYALPEETASRTPPYAGAVN